MRKIMNCLLALQKLQFDVRARPTAAQAELEKLRAEVPPPILAHYERLVARGKKGVAVVRSGVCAGCNLRLTTAKLLNLSTTPNEVHLCDNCGRYLYLPEAALVGLAETKPAPPAPTKRPSRKEAVHHVA